MTASFIPVFTDYMRNRTREETWAFANRLFWTFCVILSALTVLGVIFSPLFVRFFSMFGKNQVQLEAIYLNRLMFPYILFIGMAALAMAILNCFHIFGLPAATPILLNISFIVFSVAAVWRHFSSPAAALAVGVLVGGIFQFFLQVPQLVKRGMNFKFAVSFTDPGVRRVARLMVPGFVGIGIAQINLLVDTIFANAKVMPEGSLVSLYVADRVTELVLGGYAIAVATAILPMMSHQASAGDYEGMKKTFRFFAAHRFVYYDSGGGRPGDPARADRAGAVPARPVRGGIHAPDGARAAVLFDRAAGVRGGEVDRSGVLFDAGYADSGARGRVHDAGQRPAQRDFSFLFFCEAEKWRARAGQRPGGLFQCFHFICYFPLAIWAAGNARDRGVAGKNRGLRRRHGRRLLGRAAVFAV